MVGEGARLIPVEAAEDDEARLIAECREWVVAQGLADGIEDYELVDEETGKALAILDLAWPDGLQLELTEPAALLLNESPDVERTANASGFMYFTSVDQLKSYVATKLLGSEAA